MPTKKPAKSTARSRAGARKARPKAAPTAASARPGVPDFRDMAKMAKLMTPEQAFDLYKANARIALDVINAALENTAKLRKLQFAGEEEARSMQKKVLRQAAEATDPQSMLAASRSATQESVEKAM